MNLNDNWPGQIATATGWEKRPMNNNLPEGFVQVNDFEMGALLKRFRDEPVLRRLVGDYQRLRNIESLNVAHNDSSKSIIARTVPRTDHLPHSVQVIVACQHIFELRDDRARLKVMRRHHRRNALIRYRKLLRREGSDCLMLKVLAAMLLLNLAVMMVMTWQNPIN